MGDVLGGDYMNKPQTCCKDCAERTIGCHGACERYENYRKEVDAYNAMVRQKHVAELDYTDYKYNRINKTRRK